MSGIRSTCVLKRSRAEAGVSQLELAMRLGVSQRHVCFVENGRSRPSRRLIDLWLDEVGAPQSMRSAALAHYGFARTIASDASGDRDHAAHPARELLERMIAAHEPLPAFVFDADWRIIRANRGATWLMHLLMPEFMQTVAQGSPVDMLDSWIHPGGLAAMMRAPGAAARALLVQLEMEVLVNPRIQQRVARFARAMDERFPRGDEEDDRPSLHMDFTFDTPLGTLDFNRFQSLVELPLDVTVDSLRAETWFPANQPTRRVMEDAT